MDLQSNTGSSAEERPGAVPSWQGKRLGRFRLVALLGKGAMGKVFRAHDTTLDRHVALKTLPKIFKTSQFEIAAEQLIREARSAATIEHPHVVHIYEAGEYKGVHYIAMELLEGGTLHDLVKAVGQMDAVRACQLIAEAAEGLDHAHALGVVHRDIKPSNLMLTRGGRCKVVDFGLARVEAASGKFVPLGESVGTPQFLAPEVIQGQAATAQSDIYSLGVTLWFMLAGRAPFVADSKHKTLQMQISSALPDIRQVRPDLPEGLVLALARAMAKRPEDRFDSAGQFAKALRVHTIPVGAGSGGMSGSGLATFAQQSGMLAPLVRREAAEAAASRRKLLIGAGVGGAAALVIGVVGLIVWMTRPPTPGAGVGGGAVAANTAAGGQTDVKRAVERPAEDAGRGAIPTAPVAPVAQGGTAGQGTSTPVAPVASAVPAGGTSVLASQMQPTAAPVVNMAVAPSAVVQPPAVQPAPARPAPAASDGLPSVLDATQTAALLKIAGGEDARYPKRTATIEGVVRSAAVSSTGSVCRVEFEGVDREGFLVVYFPGMFPVMEKHFGGSAGAALAGKRIRVKGRVDTYRERPQIVVDSADQVEVVK
jgi:serine/threonine-protein kinase